MVHWEIGGLPENRLENKEYPPCSVRGAEPHTGGIITIERSD